MHVPVTKTYFMVTKLWHNIIGRLIKQSLPGEIRPPYYSWDFDNNLLRTRGNSVLGSQSKVTHRAGKVRRPSLPNTG